MTSTLPITDKRAKLLLLMLIEEKKRLTKLRGCECLEHDAGIEYLKTGYVIADYNDDDTLGSIIMDFDTICDDYDIKES